MPAILQDLRYAARGLRRTPSFTVAAVITLSLGIGATVGTYSVANAVLLEPLPFSEPDRLVRIREVTPGGEPFSVSEPTFLDLESGARTISRTAAIAPKSLTLTGHADPVRLQGAAVSQGLFAILGVSPAEGRSFRPEEDRPGGPGAVVLSHRTWRQQFRGDRGIIGRPISLDGASHVVVGVMPADFAFLSADVWVPLRASAGADRTDHGLEVIGQLSDGATIEAARAELQTIAERLGREYSMQAGWSVRVEPLAEWLVGSAFRRTTWVLLGAVGALLIIACANVANLLLARAAQRQGEISVRTALGARRRDIVRHLLAESLILAAAGGWLGLVLSFWVAEVLWTLTADLLIMPPPLTIDADVLLFALTLVAAMTIAFGLVPAWKASARGMVRGGGEGERFTSGNSRITEGFVVAQIALAMLLLVGSGLVIRSFLRLQQVDAGFVADGVIAVPLALPERQYSAERTQAFFRELLPRLEAIPGIAAAGATTTNPFRQFGFSNDVTPEDRAAEAPPTGLFQAGWRAVTPGLFETLRIPLIAGRTFEDERNKRAAIVSASLARALWPNDDAVGRRLFWGGIDGQPWTVVGVVGDVRDLRVEAPPEPMLYLPHEAIPLNGMTVMLRTALGPLSLTEPIKRTIHNLDPDLPVQEVRALAANRDDAINSPRVRTLLLTFVGCVALLLAAVGLYGLVAFGAAQRVREVGIRVALGARPADIARLFVARGMLLAGIGLAFGLAGAWALSRVVAALLFETNPRDPLLFGVAAIVLASVTAIASYLPSRRAAAADPVRVLNRQ